MSESSPFVLVKRLEADILRLLSQLDVALLSVEERRMFDRLKNNLIDARLEIQDYELAETREDQLRNAAASRKYLQKVKAAITSSNLYVFGAADVAQLTAQAEQITELLR